MSILSKPYFHDEEAAHAFLEGILWPRGAECPHCGGVDRAYKIAANPAKKVRVGLWKCGHCRKQFTIKVHTVFEGAHIPLHKCLQATYLLASSKKGISSNQLARTLEITVKSAWFLSHRIREAMRTAHTGPLGGEGKTVEADETFLGGLEKNKHRNKRKHVGGGVGGKEVVFSLVERGGKVRSFHVGSVNPATLCPILMANAHPGSALMTDEGHGLSMVDKEFARREKIRHGAGEYGRGDVHTNTVEGFFSVFKRGMKGTYQHCSKAHLARYLAEFDFRYNNRIALGVNDPERAVKILAATRGKRLTYTTPRP